MYSVYDDRCLTCRIAPFGYLRINMYLPFPAAFRSLSRPSSAPSAKAFALRPFSLDLLRVLFLSIRELFLFWFTLSAIAVFLPKFLCLKTLLSSFSLPLLSRLIQFSRFSEVFSYIPFSMLVGSNGFEPSTSRLSGARSSLLSYEPISPACYPLVEMKRFELSTSCVQGRRSPN